LPDEEEEEEEDEDEDEEGPATRRWEAAASVASVGGPVEKEE
jgi:hypothetical protein